MGPEQHAYLIASLVNVILLRRHECIGFCLVLGFVFFMGLFLIIV